MAWTDPVETDFNTNDIPTEAQILASILDNLTMLGVGARITHSAAQTLTTGTWTSLAFDTERYDPSGLHSNVTNNSRFTIPTGLGGRYLLSANWEWAANASGQRISRFLVNNTTVIAYDWRAFSGGGSPVATPMGGFSTVYVLAAGDFVEIQLQQTSGGNLDVNKAANYSPEFVIQGLGGA